MVGIRIPDQGSMLLAHGFEFRQFNSAPGFRVSIAERIVLIGPLGAVRLPR